MDDGPNVIQCLLFGALALLAIVPLISLICKSTMLRECAAEWGCTRCVSWFGNDHTNDDVETGQRDQPLTIAAYYQALYAHRGMHHRACLALGLTTWREDVRHHRTVGDIFNIKLHQIQNRDEITQRSEPLVIPTSKTDFELEHPHHQHGRPTMLCDDDEEKGDEA